MQLNFDTTTLLIYIVTGAFGTGYFVYGKKQQKLIPLLSGVLLLFYPYFVTDNLYLILIGIFLIILPFLIRF